jgi:ubiquinone/menaquinone biosynthesis C-methylase UbiE
MGWYSRIVFPRLCDLLLDRPWLARYRREQLAAVGGRILELGIGTGLNLPHYPAQVRSITAIDPNPGMAKLLARRSKRAGVAIDLRIARGERLPFQDASFDSVVSTLTMCSIVDVRQAMLEVHRVLRPGGRFVFFEHGLSPEPAVQKWQARLNWVQRILADGCRLDLDVRRLLEPLRYRELKMDSFYLTAIPRTHGFVYRGVATK